MCKFGHRPKRGGGVETLAQIVCGSSSVNINHYHLIFIIFHQYSPWFPSECHLWIIFDLCNCQNSHYQSQNYCFKICLTFGNKLCHKVLGFAQKGRDKLQFGLCPNIHNFLGGWAPLKSLKPLGVTYILKAEAVLFHMAPSWIVRTI